MQGNHQQQTFIQSEKQYHHDDHHKCQLGVYLTKIKPKTIKPKFIIKAKITKMTACNMGNMDYFTKNERKIIQIQNLQHVHNLNILKI
jgi:hypothetical protein